ncbi:MAG: two-component system response regulator [Woeseiaceae bacterium]
MKKPVALIADDDDVMRLMLSEVAISAGFDVVGVGNGSEAINVAEEIDPDIILLDVNMPELDGYSACEHLRSSPATSLTPIIVVTGNDDTASVNQAYQSGATDFVAKPINWSLIGYRLRYVLRSARNIKALQAREQKIERLAYYDSLTELPNREYLRENSKEMLEVAKRNAQQLVLLYLDLDGFKRVNDTLGHSVGDELLAAVAWRLQESLKEVARKTSDICLARIGGDEFAALARCEDGKETGRLLAEAWVESLAGPFRHGETDFYMTPSIGISVYPSHGENFEDLLKSSDTAMYRAKSMGPGRYTFFSEQMKTQALEKMSIENGLRDALREDQLELHYQPKFDVATGEVEGAEALLRWNHPQLGSVSPAKFIPIAEESGLIKQINQWVVASACRQITEWSEKSIQVPVAVNLSAVEFLHGDPVGLLVETCNSFGVPPSMLAVEVTESTLMSNVTKATEALNHLNELGFGVSVDDFGTGYSSLAYLKRFNVDALKIDQSFVADVASDSEDSAICSAIIALAKSLHLTVVAEGVETVEQYDWLVSQGCDCVQGYLVGRPLPAKDFEALLRETDIALSQRLRVAV